MTANQKSLFETDVPVWELAADEDRLTAEVVFNRPLEQPYSYIVPEELRELIQPGQRVRTPFGRGNRTTVGYCVRLAPIGDPSRRLKTITEVLDREPLINQEMLDLTEWIADRYLCGWGQVLNSVIPAGVKKKAGTRMIVLFQPSLPDGKTLEELSLPKKQHAVIAALIQFGQPTPAAELAQAAECGTGPINTLRKKGLILATSERRSKFEAEMGLIEKEDDLTLNDDQRNAVDSIVSVLQSRQHQTMLLHGVTGSGKTEVYIQAIREIVSYGRQAIVLVPEISLTPQTIRRFRSRFDSVAVLHSHLTDSERHWHWQQIANGEIQVVVGARSAVFAPTPDLGLIVIDEEHETSFKQDSIPRYHAREVARKRSAMERIPLILGSATPTLESWQRVTDGHDRLISMPKRVAKLPLPPVVIVDTRNDPRIGQGLSIGRAMHNGIQQTLKDKGQVILFLNLRGFSTTLWCRACGDGVKCPNCDITLTWHKDKKVALCHSCDYNIPPPTQCPHCSEPGVRYFGTGTQRLEQEVRSCFPGTKILRMDSDSMKKRGSHDKALESFRSGEVQILLGTQMIAKGLDFPNVTLVGVIDADTILHQPDLRATERTFQLIAQVSGRTGRSSRGGRVLVQTSSPTEPAIVAAANHDYTGFALPELQNRKAAMAPPFTQMARIILRGGNEMLVREYSLQFAAILTATAGELKKSISLLGPAPCPVARLKNNFRFHILLKATTVLELQELWRGASVKLPTNADIDFMVDVNPMNMR